MFSLSLSPPCSYAGLLLDYPVSSFSGKKYVVLSTTTWIGHLSARYQFKYDIGAAVNFSSQSGWPYSRTINVSLPNSGSNTFFSQDLSSNRADTISLLAFRLDKTITIQRFKVTGMFDLFNVLNTNAVTNFNIANGSRFNQINATVDPRTAQVGIRLEF